MEKITEIEFKDEADKDMIKETLKKSGCEVDFNKNKATVYGDDQCRGFLKTSKLMR